MPTRAAIMAPTPPPMTIAARRSGLGSRVGGVSVARMAMAMPAMPYWLPRRAVSWLDRPRRLRMNSAAATRYDRFWRKRGTAVPVLDVSAPEHGQHAPGDPE